MRYRVVVRVLWVEFRLRPELTHQYNGPAGWQGHCEHSERYTTLDKVHISGHFASQEKVGNE